MREQQRFLLDSILTAGGGAGTLHVGAPFLTFGDLLGCVRRVVNEIDGNPGALSGNTVQGWFRAGIIRPHHAGRTARNRLFCGIDIIRVATVFHLGRTGCLTSDAAGAVADLAVSELQAQPTKFGKGGNPFDGSVTNYIVAVARHGHWEIECPADRLRFDLLLQRSAVTVLFNHNAVIQATWPILQDQWNAKAEWLLGVVEREIAKKSAKRGGQ